jgi:amphiphysin
LKPNSFSDVNRKSFDQYTPPVAQEPPRLSLDLHDTRLSNQYVIALYDFEAQAVGDLSFRRDEKIEVLEKRNVNDWWVGRIGTRTGQFPGNYVREL